MSHLKSQISKCPAIATCSYCICCCYVYCCCLLLLYWCKCNKNSSKHTATRASLHYMLYAFYIHIENKLAHSFTHNNSRYFLWSLTLYPWGRFSSTAKLWSLCLCGRMCKYKNPEVPAPDVGHHKIPLMNLLKLSVLIHVYILKCPYYAI